MFLETKGEDVIKTEVALSDFPMGDREYFDSSTGKGTIERDASKINQQKIIFSVNNEEVGEVVPATPMNFVNSFTYTYYSKDNSLKINNSFVNAVSKNPDYQLKY